MFPCVVIPHERAIVAITLKPKIDERCIRTSDYDLKWNRNKKFQCCDRFKIKMQFFWNIALALKWNCNNNFEKYCENLEIKSQQKFSKLRQLYSEITTKKLNIVIAHYSAIKLQPKIRTCDGFESCQSTGLSKDYKFFEICGWIITKPTHSNVNTIG